MNKRKIAKYFLMIFLPLLALGGMSAFILYAIQVRTDREILKNNELQNVSLQKELISNQLYFAMLDLMYLANHSFLHLAMEPSYDSHNMEYITEEFFFLSKSRTSYDKVRLLDESGMEVVRINFYDGNPSIVPENELQSKKKRYYFEATLRLGQDEMYISPFDLNIEEGKIEEPPKPVIRFGTPVFDSSGKKGGIVVLNYLGEKLLNIMDATAIHAFGEIMLLNAEGFWLYGPNPEETWGFMYAQRKDRTFGKAFPEAWEQIVQAESGQFANNDGIFTFTTVCPLSKGIESNELPKFLKSIVKRMEPEGYCWKLVSHLSPAILKARSQSFFINLCIGISVISSLFAIGVWLFALIIVKRKSVEEQLLEQAALVRHNPAPVLHADRHGNVMSCNSSAKTVLKSSIAEESLFSLFPGLRDSDILNIPANSPFQFEQRIDATTFLFTVKIDPPTRSFYIYGSDITERKRAEQERRQLSIAVEQSANTIVITDLAGKIVFVNQAFEKITGYSQEEALGRNPRILKTGYLPDKVYKNLWKAISAGGVWHGEFHNKRKDGSTYWEEAVITPIKNEKGEITNYLAVKEDITKRKATEGELKKAKEAAEAANRLKSKFLANMSHEIRTPMSAILGFTELLFDQERDPEKQEKLATITGSGKHLLNLINDILDLSKIEADKIEINRKNFALRKLFDHIHNQFWIRAAEQQLTFTLNIDESVPPVVCGDEHRTYQIMVNIVGNALKFTKEGGVALDCHYADGIATIKVADTGIGILEEKQQAIFAPFEQADTSTVRQYGGTGLGLAISKRLAELMGGTIVIESQAGTGSTFIIELPLHKIAKETVADKVYLRETRIEQTDETAGENMVQRWLAGMHANRALEGILLDGIRRLPEKVRSLEDAVYRNIREDITFIAHSLKGVSGNLGMTEVYTKALQIDQEMSKDVYNRQHVKDALDDLKAIISGIPKKYRQALRIKPKDDMPLTSEFTILVAEDNEINQILIQELLKGMRMQCDVAANGEIALDKLKQKSYDILLLDMQMPVMDGLETIQRIRSDDALKELHVIALTAYAMKGDTEKYMRSGCDDYLPKPIDRERFREKMNSLLLKKLASRDQEKSKRRPEPDHLEQPKLHLNQEQRQALEEIIQGLKKNRDIFHPDQIYPLADTLAELSSIKKLREIKDELYTIADRFDDQAIGSIIKQLEVL